MRLHRLALSASATALLCAAAPAFAQSTPDSTSSKSADNTVKEVVVTGVRESVLSGQKIKKNSDQIVDSVVAEDIGKLPDDNVAEALQRVTGVQITRNADEGVSVLIRGLPNVVTLLNGRDLFTTTGRYVALADVPAAFLQRVDVYKTNGADLIEGGIAGTIDVRMHRPFDFNGLEVSGTGRAIYSDLSHRTDPNLGLLISDRWSTPAGEIGALVGVSYQERHYRNEIIDNWIQLPMLSGADQAASNPGNWAGSGAAPYNVTFPGNIGQQLTQGDRRRPAANFALQWRPSDELELYAEGFYTEDEIRWSTDFFVGIPNNTPPPPWGGITGYTLYPGTNTAKTITSSNAFSIASTQAFQVDSQTYQVAGGGTWHRGPLKITADLAYTDSTYKNRNAILDTDFFTPNVYADTNYHNSGTPYLSYTGIDLTAANNFYLFQLFDNYGRDHGDSTAFRVDATYSLDKGIFKSVQAGFRYEDRTAESQSTNPSSVGYPFGAINASTIPGLETVTPGGFFQGDATVGVTRWATPDGNFLLDHTNVLRALLPAPYTHQGEPAFDPSRYFSDIEKTYAGYVMSKAEFTLAGVPVKAVGGIRFVETDQALHGFDSIPDPTATDPNNYKVTPDNSTKSNFDVLPNLDLKAFLRDDLIARFAFSKTATRPDFSALNPAVSLQNPGATLQGTGSGGRSTLTEETSVNYDLALEWYFARTGSLTATVFYRDMNGYIQYYGDTEYYTFGYPTPIQHQFNVTRPYNTGPGHLDGFEIGYTQFYDFVPSWLKGIGAQANFTFSEGVAHGPAPDPSKPTVFGPLEPIVGLSKYSLNVIGLYERGPFSGRIAYNWRSKDVDSYNPGGAQSQTVVVSPRDFLDMSFGYKLSPKMTLTFDWVNAMNSVYHDSFGNSSIYPRDTRRYDETMELGFRWSL
jgi:TonB-dependent receptor